jgi:hypothetical protein
MNAKLCVLALLAGCTGGVGNDMTTDPNTVEDAATRDATVDARRPDASRDARAVDARSSEDASSTSDEGTDADADVGTEEDADTPGEDAAVDSSTPAVDSGTPSTGTKPVFLAVGYKATRLVSRDLGLTWTESGTLMGEGDDKNLLRAAAYANGVFVAAGWNIFTSTDATSWTPRTNPTSEWIGGLDYGNGLFVGAGGSGTGLFSSNGTSWTASKPRDGKHTRSCVFGGGKFMGATDSNDWWSTTDGNTWTKDSGGHGSNQVVWCKDKFTDRAACSEPLAHGKATAFGMGVYVSTDGNKIQRSTDGKSWTDVKTITGNAWLEDVVFGLVP